MISSVRVASFIALSLGTAAATRAQGQITFQTTDNDRRTLWRIAASPGASPENLSVRFDALARLPGSHEGPITVSPDGRWYTFRSERFDPDSQGYAGLTIAAADFSSVETVRVSGQTIHGEGLAQATSGGAAIVFEDGGGPHVRDLFAVFLQAGAWTGPLLLTGESPYNYATWPVLSLDGRKVVFNAGGDPYGGPGTRIAEVGLDGSGFRVLVSPEDAPAPYGPPQSAWYCAFPAYAPDGSSVVFEAVWAGAEQVWRRGFSGGAPSLVNASFTNDNSPVVLPDGRIASLWLGSAAGNGLHEIKLMNSDGGGSMMLTSAQSPFPEVDDVGLGAGASPSPSGGGGGGRSGASPIAPPAAEPIGERP